MKSTLALCIAPAFAAAAPIAQAAQAAVPPVSNQGASAYWQDVTVDSDSKMTAARAKTPLKVWLPANRWPSSCAT